MLESDSVEPTLEQLENLALALGFPVLPCELQPPHYQEALRNLHRMTKRAVDGDQEAAASLITLREQFAKPLR